MRLSTKSEYACLALIDLAEQEYAGRGNQKIEEIAARKHIPKKYLEQILLLLRHSGYVKSKRGADGGYRLAKSAGKISLAEVIRLMDGALAPVESVSVHFYEETPISQSKNLLKVFREIRDYISKRVEEVTFDELIDPEKAMAPPKSTQKSPDPHSNKEK